MKQVNLGKTDIRVSRIAIGTGTAGRNGLPLQKRMSHRELADLLIYAYNRGINFWDTARTYRTYSHIREALKNVKRENVVIVTKLASYNSKNTRIQLEECLRTLGTDYVDICLMHAVRSAAEFGKRRGELEEMTRMKVEGKLRAVGLSSHGLEALEAGLLSTDIDVVWGRINMAGFNMDRGRLGFYDSLAAVPLVRKAYSAFPEGIKKIVHPNIGASRVEEDDYQKTESLLRAIHEASKGVVGMKIMGEGLLKDSAEAAVKFALGRDYLDAVLIGMLDREEIDMNCKLAEGH